MRRGAAVVCLLLVLSGCSGGPATPTAEPASPSPTELDTPTNTASPTTSPTAPPTPTSTPTATISPTPTATPVPDNPWQQQEIVVAIDNQANTDRDIQPLVANTIAYWNANDSQYGDYEVTMRLEPDASEPDVLIRYVNQIETCANESRAIGCTKVLEPPALASSTEIVEIQAGYTDADTYDTLRHEFGHLYGIEHGEEPRAIMNATALVDRLPTPNASEREFPWKQTEFAVFTDLSGVSDEKRTAVENEIDAALGYYEGGNSWLPLYVEPSFTRTSNRSEADIVIRAGPDTLDGDTPSDGAVYGQSIDSDPALEYYTSTNITVDTDTVETDRVGWHVGFWLASAFSSGSVDQFPDSIRNADTVEERRSWPN